MSPSQTSHPAVSPKESAAGEEDPGAAAETAALTANATELPDGHPDGEKVPCPECDGAGHDDTGTTCAKCAGKGTITVAAVAAVARKP